MSTDWQKEIDELEKRRERARGPDSRQPRRSRGLLDILGYPSSLPHSPSINPFVVGGLRPGQRGVERGQGAEEVKRADASLGEGQNNGSHGASAGLKAGYHG